MTHLKTTNILVGMQSVAQVNKNQGKKIDVSVWQGGPGVSCLKSKEHLTQRAPHGVLTSFSPLIFIEKHYSLKHRLTVP